MSNGNVTRRKKVQRLPLDRCRLGEHRRNALQRRQIEDHEESRFFPDGHDDHASKRGIAAAQPVMAWDPEVSGDLLEQAVLRCIEEEPDIRHSDHRQHGRCEVGNAKERLALELLVHPHRHEHGKADRQRNRAERKPGVVREHLPEDRVIEHAPVIVETDEDGGAIAFGRREEAVPQRGTGGVMREERKQHGGRQKEEPAVDVGLESVHYRSKPQK